MCSFKFIIVYLLNCNEVFNQTDITTSFLNLKMDVYLGCLFLKSLTFLIEKKFNHIAIGRVFKFNK